MLEELHEAGVRIDFDQRGLDAVREREAVLARRVVPRDRELGLEIDRQRPGGSRRSVRAPKIELFPGSAC